MDPTKGKGAPLQLLPFRPQPMPTSTRAALCVPTVGKCNEGGGGAQSAAHRHAATQEQTKPPPTLLTSPPHITLLKNTHKQTKKKKRKDREWETLCWNASLQQTTGFPRTKRTSKTTPNCTPRHGKRKEKRNFFLVFHQSAPPPLPSLGRIPTINQLNAAQIFKSSRNSRLGPDSIDRPATIAIECVSPKQSSRQ